VAFIKRCLSILVPIKKGVVQQAGGQALKLARRRSIGWQLVWPLNHSGRGFMPAGLHSSVVTNEEITIQSLSKTELLTQVGYGLEA
jgi:hypothetical protein